MPEQRLSIRRQATPLLAAYWSFGQFWGVFTILLLEFQTEHDLSDGEVGSLFAVLSIAAILTMTFLAPRMQPWALAVSVPIALVTLAVGSVGIGLSPGGALIFTLIVVGVGNGLIDIYLNVAAQRVETSTGRPVLQWLHACYSLGGVTGAAIAGLLLTADLDHRWGFAYAGSMLLATAIWNGRTAPRERDEDGEGASFSLAPLFRSPFLWIPALALLGAFLVEGSLDVWAGLYLREGLGASPLAAAGAFMAFSGAAFFGRLFAGRVLFGLGRRATIVVSGAGSAAAGLVTVLTTSTIVVALAYLVLGFMLSAAAPAAFGLVEDADDEDPSAAIAGVTTIGYTGFVWAPPVIGWISATYGLRSAMAFIVASTAGIVVAGLLVPSQGSDRRTPDAGDAEPVSPPG
ncbi:MAG: MFS transporter [Actinomycetota bacterium]